MVAFPSLYKNYVEILKNRFLYTIELNYFLYMNNNNNSQWNINDPQNRNAGGSFMSANFGDYHHTDNHNRSVVLPEASTYNAQSAATSIGDRANRGDQNGHERF